MSRLKDLYKNEIMDAMIKKFGYKNVMEVPKLEKIVVNMGVGEAKEKCEASGFCHCRYGADHRTEGNCYKGKRNLSQTSKSERVCRLDVRLH